VVSSTDTDTYSAVAAAVGSLKGRRHGGANMKVMEMMDDIKENVQDWSSEKEISDYLRKILQKDAFDRTGLIYGQGHAVYTISDPRATLLRNKARELAAAKGSLEEFNLYCLIEQLAPRIIMEAKGNGKRICTNVDFFSGFVYSMLNIPRELFTPIFAISRVAGWAAHRIEEIVSGGRIYRPAFKQVGDNREYIPMEKR
jgi:citrate synthase